MSQSDVTAPLYDDRVPSRSDQPNLFDAVRPSLDEVGLSQGDTGGLWGGLDGIVTVSSNHPGGVNVCFADGSVRFVKSSVNYLTWYAIATPHNGEAVGSDSY